MNRVCACWFGSRIHIYTCIQALERYILSYILLELRARGGFENGRRSYELVLEDNYDGDPKATIY